MKECGFMSGSPHHFPRRLDYGELAAFTFDGGGRDVAGNSYDLSAFGNLTMANGLLTADGSGDYAQGAGIPALSAVTIEAWLKVNNLTAEQTVCVAAVSSTNRAFYLSFRGDVANDPFQLWFAQTNVATPPLNYVFANTNGQAWWGGVGVWHHVAGVIDPSLASASKTRIYVNGVLRSGSATSSGGTPTAINNNGAALSLGGNGVGFTSLNGQLGQVRIFNRARTATEISDAYLNTRSRYV